MIGTEQQRARILELWFDETWTTTDISVDIGAKYDDTLTIAASLDLPQRFVMPQRWEFQELTPWPEDMPRFEDNPRAHKVGVRVFIKVGDNVFCPDP